ncbi:MAG: outer membrane beta-barrel protein [Gemmobacter sp.]
MKYLTGTILSAALAAPAAFAGGIGEAPPDPVIAAPAPVPVIAPSRNWTGGYVGAELGYGDLSGDVDGDGAVGGLFGGYTHDFGNWALGGELAYDKAGFDFDTGGGDKVKDLLRLKLRAGPTFGDTFVYGVAGAARARADIGGSSESDNGWLAGVGAEYALNESWTVGGEVLYHRFNDFADTGLKVAPTTIQARASFRF